MVPDFQNVQNGQPVSQEAQIANHRDVHILPYVTDLKYTFYMHCIVNTVNYFSCIKNTPTPIGSYWLEMWLERTEEKVG